MPNVSVVMPSYNRSQTIRKAVESVLNQNYKDFELIIIDDGSTDNTKETLSEIKDKRLVCEYIDHKGASSARNKGLSLAKGKFIAFLDTDNYWHSSFLETMIQEVRKPYLMGYCSENMFLVSGNKKSQQIIGRKVRNVEYNPVKLTYTNFIDINSVLIDKTLFDEIGKFDERLGILEDWDLFVRIALKYPFKIKHIDQVLVDYYFFTKNSFSTVTNSFMSDQNIKNYFQIRNDEDDRAIIIKKIKQTLGED